MTTYMKEMNQKELNNVAGGAPNIPEPYIPDLPVQKPFIRKDEIPELNTRPARPNPLSRPFPWRSPSSVRTRFPPSIISSTPAMSNNRR